MWAIEVFSLRRRPFTGDTSRTSIAQYFGGYDIYVFVFSVISLDFPRRPRFRESLRYEAVERRRCVGVWRMQVE